MQTFLFIVTEKMIQIFSTFILSVNFYNGKRFEYQRMENVPNMSSKSTSNILVKLNVMPLVDTALLYVVIPHIHSAN